MTSKGACATSGYNRSYSRIVAVRNVSDAPTMTTTFGFTILLSVLSSSSFFDVVVCIVVCIVVAVLAAAAGSTNASPIVSFFSSSNKRIFSFLLVSFLVASSCDFFIVIAKTVATPNPSARTAMPSFGSNSDTISSWNSKEGTDANTEDDTFGGGCSFPVIVFT